MCVTLTRVCVLNTTLSIVSANSPLVANNNLIVKQLSSTTKFSEKSIKTNLSSLLSIVIKIFYFIFKKSLKNATNT